MADNSTGEGSNSPANQPKKRKELSMEMRMLIAFLLMGLVFLLTPKFLGTASKPPVKAPAEQVKSETNGTPQQSAAASPAAPSPQKPDLPRAAVPAVAASSEARQVLETDLYRIEFSNRGGVIHSWTLKKYLDNNGKPVELVSPEAAAKAGWPMNLLFKDQKPTANLNQALFEMAKSPDGSTATFTYSDGRTAAKKEFTAIPGRYRIQISSEVTEGGAPVPHLLSWRGGFGDRTVHNAWSTQQSVRYDAAASKLITQDAGDAKEGPVSASGPFSFAGLQDTFFAAVFFSEPGTQIEIQTWQDMISPVQGAGEEAHVGAAVGGSARNHFALYVGPKEQDILKQVDPKLTNLVDYGWFWWIAKPLFASLHWVHDNLIPNWGWAIVFVTVVINFLLVPLRFSSIRSMQKMSALQPEIGKINDKYKGLSMRDPRMSEKNQEMMALYSKHGINPMGGCIPMLLQMPFFFAFYKVLSVAIELRGAPWLWVNDLSQPETLIIRVLPILMIVTQVVMQKMTPTTSTDPAQQKMMMFMPVMLGVMFYTASSGLVLYWLTGNVVGIVQQWFFNKMGAKPVPVAAGQPAPKTKKK